MVIIGQPFEKQWVASGYSLAKKPPTGELWVTNLGVRIDDELEGFS
jgi:hypothetical protein